MLLAEMGRENIKLTFYLTKEDLEKLYACGFEKANSMRVLAAEIVNDLEKRKTKQDKTVYLKTTFPSIRYEVEGRAKKSKLLDELDTRRVCLEVFCV